MEARDISAEDVAWVQMVEVVGPCQWEEWHLLIHFQQGGSVFPDPFLHFLSKEGATSAIRARWGMKVLVNSLSMDEEITRQLNEKGLR